MAEDLRDEFYVKASWTLMRSLHEKKKTLQHEKEHEWNSPVYFLISRVLCVGYRFKILFTRGGWRGVG